MEAYHIIMALIALLVIALLGTIAFLMYYVGYFYKVKVGTGPSVVSELKVAYKFHVGDYNLCGPFFTEITNLCPDLRGLAIYYDNPTKIDPNKCRYIVGVILAEGAKGLPDPAVEKKMEENGFKFVDFPNVDFSVKTSHPFTLFYSAYVAGNKAYPEMINYIQREKLCAHPFLEIYEDDTIHYMVPLSKQADFYVEETKET